MFENINWPPTLLLTYIISMPFLWVILARWFYRGGVSEVDSWGISFLLILIWPLTLLGLAITLIISWIMPFAYKPINFLLKYKNSQLPKG
jgi:hypothetical protein